ncbi:MAG: TetR/AcrR family transcriptional regulator [Betaproteobacteria bacterium]|nr:TetR/AcrR family transcriptional regulator [Betaproteobacteria bacterium]
MNAIVPSVSSSASPNVSSSISDTKEPRRRRKDARPSELTAAALDLFVEKGFAATRLDDVAARAGVSKGTLYLYFDSKEALFKAVVEEGIVPALAAAEQVLAEHGGSSVDLLRDLLFGWWQQIGATRLAGVTKLIVSESRNFPEIAHYYHERVIIRGRALLRTVLQRGIARGEFRQLDVETAIDVIIAPLLMLAIWRCSLCFCEQESDAETYLETHFDLLVHGLRLTGAQI